MIDAIILSPYIAGSRGNTVTARRLAGGLAGQGLRTRLYGYCEETVPPRILADADLIHGLHAFHFGRVILPLLNEHVPLLLTLTGTDYNIHLKAPEDRPTVLAALRRAGAIAVFHAAAALEVAAAVPEVSDRISVIPPGVSLPDDGSTAAIPGVAPADKVVLIVAGLRRVKNVEAAIAAVAALGRPDVKLVHVGPVMEAATAENIRQASRRFPWFISLGEVDHGLMASLYRRADAIVNTSFSEAIPGSILEAMLLGRPVIVADQAGNRAAVEHGDTGLIFTDQDDLIRALTAVLDGEPAAAMANRAAAHVRATFAPEREISAYRRLYHFVAGKEGC